MPTIASEALRGQADTPDMPARMNTVQKFSDPDRTVKGESRAIVPFDRLVTLWINTGTLCNITCRNCYIDSSPTNDQLEYFSAAETAALLDEIARDALGTAEIGFTGGEPFMNPEMLAMARDALSRRHRVLILTNAMQPMQRPAVKAGLSTLKAEFGAQLVIRISLDHFTEVLHEAERGAATWSKTIDGIDWLAREGFTIAIAGRSCWGETEAEAREGYRQLISARDWPIDADDRSQLVLLPEMDGSLDVPEITTACWGILHKRPSDLMCATSRMVVKRKGAEHPVVLPCTLLPYEAAFEMGATLAASRAADGGMFNHGAVKLCHPHCAKFCVLGGGSCS